MQEARENHFIFVVHFLSVICYWIELYELKVEGDYFCLVFEEG